MLSWMATGNHSQLRKNTSIILAFEETGDITHPNLFVEILGYQSE